MGEQKDLFMSDVLYNAYTIKLRSQYRLESRKWESFAMVWWEKDQAIIAHPISSEELQDTQDLANAVALEHAKAWVDAKEEAKGGYVSPSK
jgi:hypothetical protein